MGITINQIATNTWQLECIPTYTEADVLTALGQVLLNAGWEEVDATNRIYRALNSDGSTYKYVGLKTTAPDPNTWNVGAQHTQLHLVTGEDWDSVNQQFINLVNYSEVRYKLYTDQKVIQRIGQDLPVDNVLHIYVSATTKWVLVYVYNFDLDVWGGQNYYRSFYTSGYYYYQYEWTNTFTGIFELTRWHAEDTSSAGYPPWIWTNSDFLCGAAVHVSPSSNDGTKDYSGDYATVGGICPRTRAGNTNVVENRVIISTGSYEWGESFGLRYIWNDFDGREIWSDKNWCSNLFFVADVNTETPDMRGYIMGLKLIQLDPGENPENYDQIDIPCNADYTFHPNGTPITHRIIRAGVAGGSASWPTNNPDTTDACCPIPLTLFAIPE